MTELKIQIETGFETEQDLKKSLQQLEGNKKIEVNGVFTYIPRHFKNSLADQNSEHWTKRYFDS